MYWPHMSHGLSKMWFIFSSPTSEVRENPEISILPIHMQSELTTKETNKKDQQETAK